MTKVCDQDLTCLSFASLLSVLRVFLGFPQSAGEHLSSVYGQVKMRGRTEGTTF
jgi:hypothetical protein